MTMRNLPPVPGMEELPPPKIPETDESIGISPRSKSSTFVGDRSAYGTISAYGSTSAYGSVPGQGGDSQYGSIKLRRDSRRGTLKRKSVVDVRTRLNFSKVIT